MSTTHYRTCPLCEATCGLAIEHDGAEVISIRGDDDDVFSRGYVCPKATALADLHSDPDRLKSPMRKVHGEWEAITWDEAFSLVAHKLKLVQKAYGKDAVAVYQGNPTAHNLGLLTYGQVFLRRLGTKNMYSATSADQLPHMLSSLLMFGHQLLFPVPDIDRTQHMLIIGGNPLVSNGSIMTAPGIKKRLRALRERGGKLVVIDPRLTETAAVADEHLFVRPGTDALLLLAMLEELFREELVAPAHLLVFIDGNADGVDEVRKITSEFPAERVAEVVGINAVSIRRLAREFAEAPSAVCYGRLGACTQEFGGINSWLINLLNILTGNMDRAGGAMFTSPAIPLATVASRTGHQGGFDRWRSRVSGLPEFGGELPVAAFAEEMETPGQGQIRALITSAGNPVLSIPNGVRLETALSKLDFMVSIDMYLNETTRHADVILPPTAQLEHDHYDIGLYLVAVRNIANYSPPLFKRGEHQRHDWEISAELASRMETSERPWGRALGKALRSVALRVGPRGVVAAGLRFGPYKGLTLEKLEAQPHGIDLGPLRPTLPDGLGTPDKRIALTPDIYVADLRRLTKRLLDERPSDSLVLIGRRHLRSNNSWMHNSLRLVKGKARCTLLVHPDDAAQLNLTDGEQVAIASRVGQLIAPIEITNQVMRGVVSLPHGWGHHRPDTQLSVAREHPGVSLNDLTDDSLIDSLSGTSSLNGVPVRLAKLN